MASRNLEDLRTRAERLLREDERLSSHPGRMDIEELFHELDVHGVELELQNEELRSSQERLQESRSRYFELYNLAPVAFLTVGAAYPHRVTGANSEACRLLGVTRTKLVGMSFTSFAAREQVSALTDFLGTLGRSEEKLADEIRMNRKSSSVEFFARIEAVRVGDHKAEPRFYVALSDITEIVRAREVLQRDRDALEKAVQERTAELEKAYRELEQQNEEIRDFTFMASHDLREPIRKVQTFGSILERYKDLLDETGRHYLGRIQHAAKRMDLMLISLLEYSRLSTFRKPFEKVSLNDVLSRVQDNLSEEITRRNARIRVGDLPTIEADAQHMIQLFQNLIANAIKFSERQPEVSVYSENGKKRCTVYVVDNGIGFNVKYLDKIFSPFQGLHAREKYEGTGMGLTICRKIAERYNGGVTATSTPGQGSVFIVTLPYLR